jgi:hypothetical protein
LRHNAHAVTQKYAITNNNSTTSSHYFNIIPNRDTIANHDRTTIGSNNGARATNAKMMPDLDVRTSFKVALSRE